MLSNITAMSNEKSIRLDISLFEQVFLRRRVLTVLSVCVAERVLAVCVATVMVVDLARIRHLVLFDAELMVCGRTTEREAVDDTVFEIKINQSLTNLQSFQPHDTKFSSIFINTNTPVEMR